MLTLRICRLPEEDARLLAKHNWAIDCRDICDTMPKEAFEFMHVVGSLPSSTSVLTVDRINTESSGSDAKGQRILGGMPSVWSPV